MDHSYLLPQLKFESEGKASVEQIVQGEKYRITMLTDRFFRFEYSETGEFCDLPSQVFWFRKQITPKFEVEKFVDHSENFVTITTKYWTIEYKEEHPFAQQTLKIYDKNGNVYYHGDQPVGNLKGTARTLDRVDGPTPLEDGLFSKSGFTVIDDSTKLVFNNHWLRERNQKNVVDFYFFGYHNDFKQGLKDYYKVAGHTSMIPRFILGNWWSRYWNYRDSEIIDVLDKFEELQIPIAVCVIDMDWHLVDIDPKYGAGWTGYTWNRVNFPDHKKFLENLKSRKIYSSLNLHPALGFRAFEDVYEEAADFMGVDKSKEQPVEFDCSDPKFMNIYFKIHHKFEEDGLDFWWIDWQQGSRSKLAGLDPLYSLNHLHFLDSKKKNDIRGFIFSRWPGLGGHRYPIGFSGDTHTTWESLAFQPYFTSTASNVGFGWWSHDIGGHYFGYEDSELYTRWVQFGVFSPIMRLHSTQKHYHKREPWRHNLEVQNIVTKYMQFRHQLIPYIYSTGYHLSKGDYPLVTPLYYHYDHKEAYEAKNQYMFGSELMVSPFVSKMIPRLNHAHQKVWIPEGEWFNFFTGERYVGNKHYDIYGDLKETPVYAKSGAIIPLAKHLAENHVSLPETLEVHVYPFNDGKYDLYEDDGKSQDYEKGIFANTVFNMKKGHNDVVFTVTSNDEHHLLPKTRNYEIMFKNIRKDVVVSSNGSIETTYCPTNKTLIVKTNDKDIEIKLSNVVYQSSIHYEKAITDMLDKTTYLVQDLIKIGYYSDDLNQSQLGLLSQNLDADKFIAELDKMNLDQHLKAAVIAKIQLKKIQGDF